MGSTAEFTTNDLEIGIRIAIAIDSYGTKIVKTGSYLLYVETTMEFEMEEYKKAGPLQGKFARKMG